MGVRAVRFDDLDGTEDGTVETHHFTFEGVAYQIDLSAENWVRLFRAVEPFFMAARPEGSGKGTQRAAERRTRTVRRLGLGRALALADVARPFAVPELPAAPTEKVPHQRGPERPADPLPMSGGFGDYKWESEDGATPSNLSYCTAAERNACARWVYAHTGKSAFSRDALAAFRAEDDRLIPGYAPVPDSKEVKGAVGKALVDATKKQRAKAKASAR